MDASPELPRPHIPPLPRAEWTREVGEALMVMQPPADSMYARRKADREKDGARPVAIFGVLANHPALTRAFLTFNRHLLYEATISDRHRELVVLRVALLRRAAYEYAQHVLAGLEAGLTREEIDRVTHGPDAPGWDALDAALLRATDELLGGGTVTPATWAVLAASLDRRQLMDLIFMIGAYETLAFALNCFDLELEPDLAAHPLPPLPGDDPTTGG